MFLSLFPTENQRCEGGSSAWFGLSRAGDAQGRHVSSLVPRPSSLVPRPSFLVPRPSSLVLPSSFVSTLSRVKVNVLVSRSDISVVTTHVVDCLLSQGAKPSCKLGA